MPCNGSAASAPPPLGPSLVPASSTGQSTSDECIGWTAEGRTLERWQVRLRLGWRQPPQLLSANAARPPAAWDQLLLSVGGTDAATGTSARFAALRNTATQSLRLPPTLPVSSVATHVDSPTVASFVVSSAIGSRTGRVPSAIAAPQHRRSQIHAGNWKRSWPPEQTPRPACLVYFTTVQRYTAMIREPASSIQAQQLRNDCANAGCRCCCKTAARSLVEWRQA